MDPKIICQWQQLFSYSKAESWEHTQRQSDDWNALVPAALWDAVRDKQEPLGHDRRSYSHWLQTSSQRQEKTSTISSTSQTERDYLFRLEGPLSSPEQITQIAGLSRAPIIYRGESLSQGKTTQFCLIKSSTHTALQKWISKEAPGFQPLFVSHSRARKELSSISIAPFLGCESMLPQYRLLLPDTTPCPQQDEYPVWYFFHGTLTETATLDRLFGHVGSIFPRLELHPAHIRGGKLETWVRRDIQSPHKRRNRFGDLRIGIASAIEGA